MASLKFRHYATESALKGTNNTVQNALNAFDVGTIVFIDDTQKQYIITGKSNNVVTYKIYYGKAAVVGVSGSGATRTLTFSDGSEIAVTINNVEHAASSDTANTAKSVAWNNVTGKPTNFVTTDGTQTITGSKIFTNNVSLQGSTSADSITAEDLIVNGAARFVSGLTGDLKGNVVGNVIGNVTGNVSGSSGSCTGNALTATTLQTARSINGTSFNGSQAITTAKWGTARTITIADNTNEHTQANNNIDGSANFTLKLPTTIKADIIGNASTANSAKSVAWANVTNKPNLVTTDTEQTITGAKIFNNNTTFKNETVVESLTADSLLVTGSARFTNTINGNLKGNVEGNLIGNASTATTAATATEFSTNKAVTLTGDVTGSASSKGGWSVATTIANGAVTNAKLANSKITIVGTAVSLGGSITASTIGAALTTSAPAAYATNAGNATKAAEATKATNDSDGNAINTTYLKKSGGTVSGALTLNGATTVNSTLTADNVTADNLTVNGAAKFNNGLEGNLKGNVDGNATTATSCIGNAATATLANEAKNLQNTTPETKDESFFSKVVIEDADMVSFQTLKGNSVVWNQLIKDFREPNNWIAGGNDITVVGDKIHIKFASASSANAFGVKSSAFLVGHKYCILMNNENAVPLAAIKLGSASSIGNSGSTMDSPKMPLITTAIPTGSFGDGAFWFWASDETQLEGDFSNIYVIDLTQMFGAGNEPTTYEEFLQRKPKVADEYAYNEGEIVNNKVEKIVTTGINLWDEQWENGFIEGGTGMPSSNGSSTSMRSKHFIPIIGGQNYYMSKDTQAFSYAIYWFEYDANFAFLGRSAYIQTLSAKFNTAYVRVGLYVTTSGVTVTPATAPKTCINISDPAINGQYFPYEKHELDLSWVKDIKDTEGVKLFEDGMRSAGTAFDEVAKGRATKRMGVYTFNGTEDWRINTYAQNKGVMAYQCYSKLKPINDNIRCDRFVTRPWSSSPLAHMTIFAIPKNGIIIETDGAQSLDDFKASLVAKPLDVYYELAEPIEVELPYGINHTLPVWKDGMMYVESSQSSTPIVCTNAYYTNIRESVKKFIGDADSIYASTSGYNAHGTWNIDISGKASSAITANSAITATSATTATTCTGNAGTATTLQNTRKINGTDFNGSADITTSKWGTARNITISDGTNSGTATSVDGSGAITLNLPGTIKANLSGNASSATKATNDGNGNTITSTYATKTERANNDITAASLNATKLTLTRAAGNITANIPTWNQDTTGTAAKATADAKGNNIINTYATKAEVAALPKSMVIKGTLDATHALPTSGMTEGDTYIVGASGKYNNIACKVGDFFVRTSNNWLRIPAGDEWEYNENTIKGIKVNNAGHADTADTAVSAGSATSDSNGNNIANTYARINKVYDDSGDYRQFLGKNGDSSSWIRTTTTGILPYTSGDSSHGNSSLGTPTWYFSKAYIQNIYGYLNGNISGNSTSCSGNAATATKATQDGNGNIIASSYARKISLTAPESNYTDFVILLCSLDNTNTSADLYCFGTLYLKRSNILSSQIQKVDICVGKNYNSTDPIFASLSASNAHPRPKLVTCIYEGKPYVALYFYIDGSSYTTSYFIGQCSDYTSLKCIKTYHNTTKDIINEEIYNSITPIVTTEIPYVFYGLPKVSKDHGATVEDIALVSSDITGNAATATTASSCSGNSATATKAGCLDTGTMTLYAHNSNEINFGGTSTSSEIHVGYRAIENKPIPTSFIFGGSTGTATLTAGGFKKKDSDASYVLTGDGGHTKISGLSVNYATSSGSCSGNSATATKATQDSDGNAINTTYLKRSGGTVTGNVTFNSSVTIDSLTTEDLIVNGSARFVSGLTGDLVGNVTGNLTGTASYATNAGSATTAGNANTIGGISISKLVYGSNSTKTTNITEDQLNAPLASGFYTITNTTTGSNATIPNATSVSMILHTSYSGLDNNAGFDLLINDSLTSSLHFRPATGAGKGAWKTLIDTGNIGSQSVNYAATSGSCSGNSATATKLQTARTIWGQSFDGSKNISGDIINTGNIRPSVTKTSDLGSNALSYRYVYTTWVGAPGNTKLFLGAANAEHLTIDTSGNVGIGTPSPTSKLHVVGTGYFASDVSSAANIIAGGYIKGETVKISSGCTLEYDSTQKCIRFVFS